MDRPLVVAGEGDEGGCAHGKLQNVRKLIIRKITIMEEEIVKIRILSGSTLARGSRPLRLTQCCDAA
jgi:hypothetical protein